MEQKINLNKKMDIAFKNTENKIMNKTCDKILIGVIIMNVIAAGCFFISKLF